MDRNDFFIIADIAERSEKMGIGYGNRITRIMDVEVAHKRFNLRLQDFLEADDLDFAHDFCGIQSHIVRKKVEWVDDMFLPRFA